MSKESRCTFCNSHCHNNGRNSFGGVILCKACMGMTPEQEQVADKLWAKNAVLQIAK